MTMSGEEKLKVGKERRVRCKKIQLILRKVAQGPLLMMLLMAERLFAIMTIYPHENDSRCLIYTTLANNAHIKRKRRGKENITK